MTFILFKLVYTYHTLQLLNTKILKTVGGNYYYNVFIIK